MPNRPALNAGAKAFVATCHVLASCDGPRAKRPSRIGVVGERHEVSEPRATASAGHDCRIALQRIRQAAQGVSYCCGALVQTRRPTRFDDHQCRALLAPYTAQVRRRGGCQGADPGRTNMGVHKDGGLGADELCAGRDREAVVAIGRAGPGHRGRSAPDLGALDFLRPASPNALASAGSSSKPYSGRRFRSSIWTENLLGCKRGKN